MTTVQRRHRYARLYLCSDCIKLAQKHNEVFISSSEKNKVGLCEVCRETRKLQEVFTTAFRYGV